MSKYKITLNNVLYEVEVIEGKASIINEAPAGDLPEIKAAPVAAAAAAPVAAAAAPAPAAAPAAPVAGGTPVPSPLPGTILKVEVKVGDQVSEGQAVLLLEAMKMENPINAPKAGTVTQILVSAGQAVQAGDNLIVIA